MRIISISYFLTVVLSIVYIGFVHSEDEYTLDIIRLVISSAKVNEIEHAVTFKEVIEGKEVIFSQDLIDGELVEYTEVLRLFVLQAGSTGVLDSKSDLNVVNLPYVENSPTLFAFHWTEKPSSNNLRAESTSTAISAKACYDSSALYQILIALKEFPSAIPIVSEDFEVKFLEEIKAMITKTKVSENIETDLTEIFGRSFDADDKKFTIHNTYTLFMASISAWIPSMDFYLCEIELFLKAVIECMRFTDGVAERLDKDVILTVDSEFMVVVLKVFSTYKDLYRPKEFVQATEPFWKDHADSWTTMTMVSPGSGLKSPDNAAAIEQFFGDIQHLWGFESIQLTNELKWSPGSGNPEDEKSNQLTDERKWPSTDGHPKDTKARKSFMSKIQSSCCFGSREATQSSKSASSLDDDV